jgi:hypothetical protein
MKPASRLIGKHWTHAAAEVFPMLDDEKLKRLADDIKANGQIEAIDMKGDLILDGRNRYLACEIAGIEPRLLPWEGTEAQAIAHVVGKNFMRRQMTEWQCALAMTNMAELFAKLAKEERKRNLKQLPLSGVPKATAAQVDAIRSDAEPEVRAALDRGDIHMSLAAEIAGLEPDAQRAVIERIEKDALRQPAPIRAVTKQTAVTTNAIQFSLINVQAMQCAARSLRKSAMPELRMAGELIPLLVPGVE